jgi:protein TonB
MARETLSETSVAAAPRGPVIFDARPQLRPPSPKLLRPRLFRIPAKGALQAPPIASRADAPIRNFDAVENPADLPSETGLSGACTSGCVVGPVEAVGGDESTGSPGGVAGPEVVAAGPGGRIDAPAKLRDRSPVYPYLAIQARIEGRVEIECRIDTAGHVVDATVRSGHPLLAPAALDAVRQWAYKPTLLNGVPVSVIMTVTVHFHLRR